MKRLSILTISLILQICAFAQRGRIRPEWDLDGGHSVSRHNIDDDFYSFLLIIGIIVIIFIIAAIKGYSNKNKTERSHKPSRTFTVLGGNRRYL